MLHRRERGCGIFLSADRLVLVVDLYFDKNYLKTDRQIIILTFGSLTVKTTKTQQFSHNMDVTNYRYLL